MDLVPKPVISWAGHNTLISELETRCSQTISKEPSMWRHSKRRGQYTVRIDASFTRFNGIQLQSPIKVLSTGRPIRPMGSFQPLLYIYAISNNHTEYISGGGRNKISSWLGHLQAANISDWVILMIDAESQIGGPKMFQRSTVLQLIKKDFNITSDGFHFLQLPDPRAVEEKVFQDAWTTMMRALRKVILEVYHRTIADYDLHLRLLEEARFTNGWDFFEYLDRKEELAQLYAVLGGYEDALNEYYEVEHFFCKNTSAVETSETARPPWIRQLIKVSKSSPSVPSFLSCFPIVPSVTDSDQAARIRERQGTLFDIRTYLLSKQLEFLSLLNKLHRVPSRVFGCISTTVEQSHNLQICEEPVFESCWAFLVAMYSLELLRHRNSVGSRDVASSVNLILFAAFGPHATSRPDELHASQPDPAYQPYNNVFLRGAGSDNPMAEPLAILADVIYTIITSKPGPQKSKNKTTDVAAGFTEVCNALVDLWLIAFVHLTRLGYLLQLWHTDPHLDSHAGALKSLESAVHTCAKSQRTDLSAFGMSIHKQMPALLSSRTMYAEIYVAMGQTLTGFFKLIGRQNKAIYASSLLASFLQAMDATHQACVLFTHSLAAYLYDGWPQLATQTCLRLACCLRSLLSDMKRKQLCSDSALARYLHCCIQLACTSPTVLRTAIKSCDLPPEMRPDYALSFDGQAALPAVDQLISPDFWWYQSCKVLKLFPRDQLWDCTRMLPSPFKLHSIQLNGASDSGAQLITVTIEVTTHMSFATRVSASASYPRSGDWHSIMDYGHVTQMLRHLTEQSSSKFDKSDGELTTVDLKPPGPRTGHLLEVRSPSSTRSTTDLSRLEAANHMKQTQSPPPPSVAKSTEELAPDLNRRRKSSFLDVAASWATKPAWKSQEQLNKSGDSPVPVERAYSKGDTLRRPTLSPIGSPGLTVPERSVSITTPPNLNVSPWDQSADELPRRSTSSEPRTGQRSFSFSEFAPASPLCAYTLGTDNDNDHPFLTQYRRLRSPDQSTHSFNVVSKPDNLVQLNPGINKITLVSQASGFLIPGDIRITVLNRIPNRTADDDQTKEVPLHLAYRVQPKHFHSSWSDQSLLDSLLPRLYEVGQKKPLKAVRVILGLRQDVNLQLELGQLGLPVQTDTQVNLFRIVHRLSPQSHGLLAPPSTGPVRVPKVVNNYHVSPLFEPTASDGSSATNDDGRRRRITTQAHLLPNDYRCELHDGPVALNNSVQFVPMTDDQKEDEKAGIRTLYRLSRPLWIRALADNDEFAISMPSGYLYRLPVDIIRPLALTLSVCTNQKRNVVIFAIRIACMDLHDNTFQMTSPLQQPILKPIMPLTFRLTKCQLMITAPNIPDLVVTRADSIKKPMERDSSVEVTSGLEEPSTTMTNGTDSAGTDAKKPRNCMIGIPVDPRNTEAVVNRLCPATLLWQLKFSEFRPFVNSVLERFSEPPEARFQCTFTRLDDPTCESQLSFHRRISPIRQPVDKTPSLSGFLARTRKERGSS